jgi:hypothetical protein
MNNNNKNNINKSSPSCDRLISPVKSYGNAELFREAVLKDNRGQSGIYRWVNNLNKKTYVGSGVDLAKEFTNQTEAGEFIGVTRQAIYNAIKRGTRIKGIYIISKIDQ